MNASGVERHSQKSHPGFNVRSAKYNAFQRATNGNGYHFWRTSASKGKIGYRFWRTDSTILLAGISPSRNCTGVRPVAFLMNLQNAADDEKPRSNAMVLIGSESRSFSCCTATLQRAASFSCRNVVPWLRHASSM